MICLFDTTRVAGNNRHYLDEDGTSDEEPEKNRLKRKSNCLKRKSGGGTQYTQRPMQKIRSA